MDISPDEGRLLRAALDQPLPRRFRRTESAHILVISPCGFIRLALAQRLADIDAALTLASESSGVRTTGVDTAVVGPYMEAEELARNIDRVLRDNPEADVIEVCDPPVDGMARLWRIGADAPGATAQAVLAALDERRVAIAGAS